MMSIDTAVTRLPTKDLIVEICHATEVRDEAAAAVEIVACRWRPRR